MIDLLVVGAGSSGAVIAARASENPNLQVLLIEAGPDYEADDVPADLRDGRQNSMTAHDWGYKMRGNDRMKPLFDYPRGRVVGGSSAVNTCIALRSRPQDYDEWGFAHWRFDACLPYFKRLETDLDFPGKPWHGSSGPIPIRHVPEQQLQPWLAAFVQAGTRLGYPYCEDTNDPARPVGIGPHAMNVIDGERMSVARCYLTPAVRARSNLTIRANTHVRRVIVGSPLAVEVQTRGEVQRIEAKHIVLSGGAINTPGLMLRSGLGPKASVQRLGVALSVEVPGVAEQLWEHPGSALFFRPRYWPRFDVPLIQTVLRIDDMYLQPATRVPLPRVTVPLITISGHVGKPRLASRLVFHRVDKKPHIFARALEDGEDRKKMGDALKRALEIARQPEMAALGTPLFPRTIDDAYLRKWSATGYHPCGTVPMGVSTDGYGRVHGVEGLYVADASLMPTIPMANTNLTCIMMGERFGEWFQHGAI